MSDAPRQVEIVGEAVGQANACEDPLYLEADLPPNGRVREGAACLDQRHEAVKQVDDRLRPALQVILHSCGVADVALLVSRSFVRTEDTATDVAPTLRTPRCSCSPFLCSIEIPKTGDLGGVVGELQVSPGQQVDEAMLPVQAPGELAAPHLVQLLGPHLRNRIAPAEVHVRKEPHCPRRRPRPLDIVPRHAVAAKGVIPAK
jgi:hypothetical protein